MKEIKLYLCRDEKSGEMLETFRRELNLLPREARPKLKAKILRLQDPSKFEQYLKELEELFGGLYVQEFKKHDIRAVPAVVIDDEKVSEGRYLTREEIRELLGISPAQPPLPSPQPAPVAARPAAKPADVPPVEFVLPEEQGSELELATPTAPSLKPEKTTPKQPQKALFQQPTPTARPAEGVPEVPLVIEPVRVEPVSVERQKPPPPRAQEHPAVKQQATPAFQPPEPQRVEQPVQPPPQRVSTEGRLQTPAAKFTCHSCIHFNPERNRCRILHITVPDPNTPPCGRGRR